MPSIKQCFLFTSVHTKVILDTHTHHTNNNKQKKTKYPLTHSSFYTLSTTKGHIRAKQISLKKMCTLFCLVDIKKAIISKLLCVLTYLSATSYPAQESAASHAPSPWSHGHNALLLQYQPSQPPAHPTHLPVCHQLSSTGVCSKPRAQSMVSWSQCSPATVSTLPTPCPPHTLTCLPPVIQHRCLQQATRPVHGLMVTVLSCYKQSLKTGDKHRMSITDLPSCEGFHLPYMHTYISVCVC